MSLQLSAACQLEVSQQQLGSLTVSPEFGKQFNGQHGHVYKEEKDISSSAKTILGKSDTYLTRRELHLTSHILCLMCVQRSAVCQLEVGTTGFRLLRPGTKDSLGMFPWGQIHSWAHTELRFTFRFFDDK